MHARLYSETIGIPIISETSGLSVAVVKDVLLDHMNGKIMAFLLPGQQVVLPIDILEWEDYLLIPDESHIMPLNEVVRVAELFRRRVTLFGKKVVTESGVYLGCVHDMAFDEKSFVMTQIHVAKFFLVFRFEPKIIAAASIVEIRKDIIVVKNLLVKEPEKTAAEVTLSPA